MRLLFCGTPQFAVPTLQHLLSRPEFDVLGVISQPDRHRGRGQQISVSPVKDVALAAHLPVHQPEKIRAPEVQQLLERLAPDVIVIIAYGQIIPARLLSIPKHGWINLHASLLPKYRGAAPVHWAIANGETQTGLTTMRIDAGMDTGGILLQREMEIGPAEAARIAWNSSALEIYNRMRGFAPWPGAYTTFRGQTCHLWGEPAANDAALPAEIRADPSFASARSVPGALFGGKWDWFVACGKATALRLQSVKLEGRKQVSAAEFANGARLKSAERFGDM